MRYGNDVGPDMARVMLLSWLPSDIRVDVNKRRDLRSVPVIIDHIKEQLRWEHSEMLARERTKSAKSRAVFSINSLSADDWINIKTYEQENPAVSKALKQQFGNAEDYTQVIMNAVQQKPGTRKPPRRDREDGRPRDRTSSPAGRPRGVPNHHREARKDAHTETPRQGG